jgi:aarF domain-containing kinase
LDRIFVEDLRAMTLMLKAAKTFFEFPFSWAMPEFKAMLASELSFINEGTNCERTDLMFADNPQIIVPKIHWSLTASKVSVQ